MATHYTKERSKYGTLTGTVVAYPVELASGSNPNNFDMVEKLPAGYLRCDGSKYNARDYPLLAEICGTGLNCKFLKFDINDEVIGSISDEEFVVPDLGSKIPRPVSGGDAGVFNNILTTTQNGTTVTRSGIGIEATVTNFKVEGQGGEFESQVASIYFNPLQQDQWQVLNTQSILFDNSDYNPLNNFVMPQRSSSFRYALTYDQSQDQPTEFNTLVTWSYQN